MLKRYLYKNLIEAGCDEAGRGCLAGPVFAAAVILPKNFKNVLLNDSKKLTDKQRYELRLLIEEKAVTFAVGEVCNKEIDEINILNASFLAMHKALDKLQSSPEIILVDGNRFKPYKNIKHDCIVKGDSKMMNIAAASVLAKTYRDDYMKNLALQYHQYGWEHNMGYPTSKHREGIRMHGPTAFHRLTFTLLPKQQLVLELAENK
jgi:ribonuclease HII